LALIGCLPAVQIQRYAASAVEGIIVRLEEHRGVGAPGVSWHGPLLPRVNLFTPLVVACSLIACRAFPIKRAERSQPRSFRLIGPGCFTSVVAGSRGISRDDEGALKHVGIFL
jgi:hypothetical protein